MSLKRYLKNLITDSDVDVNIRTAMKFLKHNKIEGSYLEFGVARGCSAVRAIKEAKDRGLKYDFWLFDSYEGLPETHGVWDKGDFNFSLEEVKDYMVGKGINLSKVHFIKGWFKHSLKRKHKHKKIAMVYIDVDLYKSAVDVLNYIEPHLQDGSIILFDNWYAYNNHSTEGEQRAYWESEIAGYTGKMPSHGLQKMFSIKRHHQ